MYMNMGIFIYFPLGGRGGCIWQGRTGAGRGGTVGRHAKSAYRGTAEAEELRRRTQSAFPNRGGQRSMRAVIQSGFAAVTGLVIA